MTFATRRVASIAKTSFAVAGVTAMLIASTGCDDSHQADRRVRETVQKARIERAKQTEEGLAAAQKLLSEAAGETNADPATQAHAKGVLAQAQYEQALQQIADPQTGIDAGDREVLRLIWEINQLGSQVNASNGLVKAYRTMEPKDARNAVQQHILEATGDAQKPTWVGQGENAIPTLSAVQGQVQQSQDAVTKQQELIKGLQAQQEQLSTQAQQAATQSEAVRGRAGLDLFRQAAGLRKQAADVATRIESEQQKLGQLEHDLKLAQARQQAVTTAIDQFKKAGEQIEQGWKGVEAQAVHQQQLATQILNGGGESKSTASIADKAKALNEALNKNKERFDSALESLNSSADNFGKAAQAATTLKNDLGSKANDLPKESLLKTSIDTLTNAADPNYFKVGQASAQLALANLQVSRAQALNERAKLLERLRAVLTESGLSVPKELDDPGLAAAIKDATEQATTNFTAAMEGFESGGGGSSDAVKRAGRSGKIYSLYGQALLARATGNAANAETVLTNARAERDLAIQESPTMLAALPAELVPPPSTQPVGGATTAPAATTPAEGAAPAAPAEGTPTTPPAEGATPPTPPAEGTAPATTPAEGAAPATPPAEGAAPAAPAAPADGAAAPAAPADGAAAPAAPAAPAEGTPAPAPAAPQ